MPLTPLHLGSGLFLGALTLRYLNLWAILLGSAMADLESLWITVSNQSSSVSHHGFFHTFSGAFFGSLITVLLIWFFRKELNSVSRKFKIAQSFSLPVLFFSSFLGWILHVFFDNLAYNDVYPFWPSKFKPFYLGYKMYWSLNDTLLVLGVLGATLLFLNWLKRITKSK